MSEPTVHDPRLAALVAAERHLPSVPSGTRERILARVRATVASPPPPPKSAVGGIGLKLALVIGGVGAIVLVVGVIGRGPAAEPTPAIPARAVARIDVAGAAASAPRLVNPTTPAPSTPAAPHPVVTSPPAPPTTTPAAVDPTPPVRSPELERRVLERAQAAIAAGDFEAAMGATREHERRWPRGALVEEREVLRVRALVGRGDHVGARAAADAFRERFPRSIHRAAIDTLAP